MGEIDDALRQKQMHTGLTILLGLVHSRHLIGKSPKEQGRDHTSPHFCQDVKDCKGPISDNSQWRTKAGWEHGLQRINEGMWVQDSIVGINDQCKGSEEDEERQNTCVKYVFLLEFVTKSGVDGCESNGRRKIAIRFDERNNFGARLWGCYHQHVLRVSQNGVVEEDAEKHDCQGNQLFSFLGRWDGGLELLLEVFR